MTQNTLFYVIYSSSWKNHNICTWRTWSWVSSRSENIERFVEAFLIGLQISFFTTHYMEFVKCFTLQDSRNLKFRPKKRIHHDIFGEKIRMQDVSILNKSSIFVTAVTLWKLQPEFSKFYRYLPEQKDILHKCQSWHLWQISKN